MVLGFCCIFCDHAALVAEKKKKNNAAAEGKMCKHETGEK
jgi:hypothetical protein